MTIPVLTQSQYELLKTIVEDDESFWGGWNVLDADGLILIQQGLAIFTIGKYSTLKPTDAGKLYVKRPI